MSEPTNHTYHWEDNDPSPCGDDGQEAGDEEEEGMRLGGTLSGMSFWDALIDELEWRRCGRA